MSAGPDSGGVTPQSPLEAAARALWEGPNEPDRVILRWPQWSDLDDRIDANVKLRYLSMARAALTAAIEALPRNPAVSDQIWFESDSTSVLYAISANTLRRALLGET